MIPEANDIPIPKRKLDAAFRALRKKGYIARQRFLCCGSCGGYALAEHFDKKGIPEGKERKAVWYCEQSDPSTGGIYVNWQGDPVEICGIIRSVGLQAYHDGDEGMAILIEEDK